MRFFLRSAHPAAPLRFFFAQPQTISWTLLSPLLVVCFVRSIDRGMVAHKISNTQDLGRVQRVEHWFWVWQTAHARLHAPHGSDTARNVSATSTQFSRASMYCSKCLVLFTPSLSSSLACGPLRPHGHGEDDSAAHSRRHDGSAGIGGRGEPCVVD